MGSGMPKIPAVMGTCPTLATGNITVLGQSVSLSVGTKQADKKGPVFFYWHGTGSSAAEVALLGPAVSEITGQGGLVASFSTSTAMGTNTGDAVWYTGDFAMADQILACAVQQLNIDTQRIYTGGCSAGGLQSGWMLFARSSYIAAAMPNSGGVVFAPAQDDPSHIGSLITTHGAPGTDVVVIDFSMTSATEDKAVVAKGGFAVDCNHGGGHCQAPAADTAGQWQFCKDHPFGVKPEPYASGLPSSLPSYCTIVK
jgi:poly(3-hydroxybutyrate) depolymerase